MSPASHTSAKLEMSSTRMLLCEFCVILLFTAFCFVLAEEKSKSTKLEAAKGNCTCGGFSNVTPEANGVPILSQQPGLVVNCDKEGENTCNSLCTALAMATKAKGTDILCHRLVDAEDLKLSAFSKVCDKPWLYANMTAEQNLCCEKGKTKVCASAANTTTPYETYA